MAFCLEDLPCCLEDSYEEEYWNVPDEGKSTLESTSRGHEFIAYWPSIQVYKEYKERNEYISSWLPRPASVVCMWHSFGAPQCAKLSVLNDWATILRSRHARGVVHGNLTPESVGIVHGKGILNTLALSQPTRISRTGESRVGDVTDVYGARWAATEFFRLDNGDPCPTKMSDVYSFACLMLQVLTGSVPYCATKRPEQVVYLKYLGREPIDAQTPEVADRYVALMRWCWSPEPDKRPSMETIVDFIEEEINRFEE
ncbi:kinase-like domain-containing protein [Boletus edulis BED1]|uniref:Kinase-like domain-containing protein n=1 Tax=Boletus edulis BED1 TaxID=1328754 RepID=A0AAD4GDW5_BOLED|nr:kinase-like domain-containing protein [Boletus edulis BED1]